MKRVLIACLATLVFAAGATAGEPLPRPAALEPNVRFWMRIYSEVDSAGGLIHDNRHLDIVYETLRFPKGISNRSRDRVVGKARKRHVATLRNLARGKRTGLSKEESRVLALWPKGTSNATFREAAGRIRFQRGLADRFREGLIRKGIWADHIVETLEAEGVPIELDALPHVESSYNPRAYSRVGAAGLWQFTRSTGRLYMRVDHVVDERMDPYKATTAAARLLRHNHERLKSWPLAITAYNHGVGGMERAVRKLGTRDIGEISARYKSRIFGFASRNFYSEFLAANEIDQNVDRFFGRLHPSPPIEYQMVEMDHFYRVDTLRRALGIDREVLREHNLALRPSVWNGAKYVPRGYELRIPSALVMASTTVAMANIPAKERLAEQHRDRFYKVRRGDTLSKIARRFRVRQHELVALNNLRSRHRIRVGQVLSLPDDARGAPTRVARSAPPVDGIYRVNRGDTLSKIAKRFGVSERKLVSLNSLSNKHRLTVGQSLRITNTAPVAVAVAVAVEQSLQIANNAPSTTVAAAEAPVAAKPAIAPEASPVVATQRAEPPPSKVAATPLTPERQPVASTSKAPPSPLSHDPSNYAVSADARVTVQAEETLGHYAEWLDVRASQLRRVNGMRSSTPVVIGREIRLDFSRITPETFEQRRLAYHRELQEDFFGAYVVTHTQNHELRKGDTLWSLARQKFEVPVWLLRQYNPDLDFGELRVGMHMVIPRVEPREG